PSDLPPERYNQSWWELRERYQGIASPVPRSEEDFDPGAKYHIPANVPYLRYFLAHILQFQFHKAMCEAAGHQGILADCSVFGSKEAGEKLQAMLALGQSRPWPDALELLTGTRTMDAGPLLEYFEPLRNWLQEQNQGQTCGWCAARESRSADGGPQASGRHRVRPAALLPSAPARPAGVEGSFGAGSREDAVPRGARRLADAARARARGRGHPGGPSRPGP